MKPITFSRKFEKYYTKRIGHNEKLKNAYSKRYLMFVAGERGYPIDDHALSGELTGKRAFSISSDIRVVYEVVGDEYIFLDIGTHNQVYR